MKKNIINNLFRTNFLNIHVEPGNKKTHKKVRKMLISILTDSCNVYVIVWFNNNLLLNLNVMYVIFFELVNGMNDNMYMYNMMRLTTFT